MGQWFYKGMVELNGIRWLPITASGEGVSGSVVLWEIKGRYKGMVKLNEPKGFPITASGEVENQEVNQQ